MAADFGEWLEGLRFPYSFQIAIVVVTIILSYFNLVLGELVPKRIALQYSDKIALFMARPVRFVSICAAPFIWFLSKSVAVVLRLFGIKKDSIEETYSEEEIKLHLDVGIERGAIDEPSKEMIASVFEFDDKLAYEIMTPRTDIFMVNINDKLEEYVDALIKSRFSRIPYFDKDNDDIVGVLYMKDYIIQAKKAGFNRVNVKKLLQKPFFTPETKNIDDLFREMQEHRIHMAFLVDEYGGVSGLVTIEDIVEEIMGAIDDEYDDTEPKLEQVGDNSWRIDGSYYLDDLNDELGLSLESDDVETIGGLLMDNIGEIPDDGDNEKQVAYIDGNKFTVESWNERRIDKVLVEIFAEADTEDAD
jgi:putative hemolysin